MRYGLEAPVSATKITVAGFKFVIDHPEAHFFEHSPEYMPSTSSLWLAKALFAVIWASNNRCFKAKSNYL